MVPRVNKNNAYAKFVGTNKEYYGIFRSGLLYIAVLLSVSLDIGCKAPVSYSRSLNKQQQNVLLQLCIAYYKTIWSISEYFKGRYEHYGEKLEQ